MPKPTHEQFETAYKNLENAEKRDKLQELIVNAMFDSEVFKYKHPKDWFGYKAKINTSLVYSNLGSNLGMSITPAEATFDIAYRGVEDIFSNEPPAEFIESHIGENLRLYKELFHMPRLEANDMTNKLRIYIGSKTNFGETAAKEYLGIPHSEAAAKLEAKILVAFRV